jgi:aryl-alcohol dehydrogenase-like predicted oxidoreductase
MKIRGTVLPPGGKEVSSMRYKLPWKSGVRVSGPCLGTMTFGSEREWGATKEESRKAFRALADAGGNRGG